LRRYACAPSRSLGTAEWGLFHDIDSQKQPRPTLPCEEWGGTKKAIKQQLGHGATGFLMKSAKVATASRFASSLPTLMRSALGNP